MYELFQGSCHIGLSKFKVISRFFKVQNVNFQGPFGGSYYTAKIFLNCKKSDSKVYKSQVISG